MNGENYDPYYPEQPVVDKYLPTLANLPTFRAKRAFIWVDDCPSGPVTTRTITYAELDSSVQSISAQLRSSPLQRSDTVVILCAPGLELVEFLFGCQRAGLLCVPIIPPNPSFSSNDHHHLLRVMSQTKPKAAIANGHYIKHVQQYIRQSSSTDNHHFSHLLQNLKWISTDAISDYIRYDKNVGKKSSVDGCKPNDVYLIQHTSGATGIPKPVLVTAGSAAHNVSTARKAYDLHPNSIIVSLLPQYHDCGLMILLLTIVSGATCVLTSPNTFINRPRIWLEMITRFKATCTPVPSFTLPLVVERGGYQKGNIQINLWSMKNLIIINEPIYEEAIEEFVKVFMLFGLNRSSISPSYGLTENCPFVSTAWRSGKNGSYFPSYNKLLPSARLVLDEEESKREIDIILVNERTHELVEDGVEGEIWVASPSNASGYLHHPSLTREVFQARLKGKVSDCYVRTGDRGIVMGEERYLFVTGRSADIIKLQNGEEIHPHYLETAAYNSCPQLLRGGCLSAFEISNEISRKIAVVAKMHRGANDEKILRKVCHGIRESVMKEEGVGLGLVALVKGETLPKTTSGKIKRWAAKDKFLVSGMDVVMQVEFNNDPNRSQDEHEKILIEPKNESIFLSRYKASIYPALVSSL